MARLKFHTVFAVAMLIGAGAWVATGEFTFVGSAVGQDQPVANADAPAAADAPVKQLQTVAYITATPSDYSRLLNISGRTEADKQTVLAARTSGVVAQLPVSKGQFVAKGDIVMALDGPEKYAAVTANEALVKQREHLAEVNAELLARGKIAPLQADDTTSALAGARSALEAARADVERLELRAPFGGIVDDVMVEEGAWVQPGAPVASLLALDPIIAVGEVSERDLQFLSIGASAKVKFGDGSQVDGEIRFIRRAATDVTRTFPVEVAVPNPGSVFPAGMSADISLSTRAVPSVFVPRSAITLGPDGSVGVRTVTDDSSVAFVPVSIIDDTPKGLLVSGLAQGLRVIVSGQDLVSDGQKVIAVDAALTGTAENRGTN